MGRSLLRRTYGLLLEPLPPIESDGFTKTPAMRPKGEGAEHQGTSNQDLAIKWASQKGYPVPDPPTSGLTWAFLYGAGVALCGFPVVIVALFHGKERRERQQQIDTLVIKWIDAGKPLPEDKETP